MVDFVKEEYEETDKEDHEGLLSLEMFLIIIESVFCFKFLISISFQGHFQENNRPIESINLVNHRKVIEGEDRSQEIGLPGCSRWDPQI